MGPTNAQCGARLVNSTHLPNTHHQIGLALRCMHQRVRSLGASQASPLQEGNFLLCQALAATFPSPEVSSRLPADNSCLQGRTDWSTFIAPSS